MDIVWSFVDHNLSFRSVLLAFKHISVEHTSENLALEVDGTLQYWKLSSKITTATTDSAANIKKAMTGSANFEWIFCLAHLLNLVVKGCFTSDKIKSLLSSCRSLVGTFKHSSTLTEKLKVVLKSFNESAVAEAMSQLSQEDDQSNVIVPQSISLRQEVETRWNSTYIMLDTLFRAHDSIRSVIYSSPEY